MKKQPGSVSSNLKRCAVILEENNLRERFHFLSESRDQSIDDGINMVERIRETERHRKRGRKKRRECWGRGEEAQERILEQTFPRHFLSTGHCSKYLTNVASFDLHKALRDQGF